MSDASEITNIDLEYFIRFTLLDKVSRKPSKRPTEPMRGIWTAHGQKLAPNIGGKRMRTSDEALRCFVCISAVIEVGGEAVFPAVMRVAELVGKDTAKQSESLRVRYHQIGTALSAAGQTWRNYLPTYWGAFLSWRSWVLHAEPEELDFETERFAGNAEKSRALKLRRLIDELQADPEQRLRDELWTREQALLLEESLKGAGDDCRVPELAAYLAALKCKLGESREAIQLLDRALSTLHRCQDSLAPQRYRELKRHCRLLREHSERSQSERPRLSDPV